jgi:hypothetical protein
MLLMHGKANLHWKDLVTKEEKTIELIAPIRVQILANIWHELIAVTDIVYIELNSLSDGIEDTHRI